MSEEKRTKENMRRCDTMMEDCGKDQEQYYQPKTLRDQIRAGKTVIRNATVCNSTPVAQQPDFAFAVEIALQMEKESKGTGDCERGDRTDQQQPSSSSTSWVCRSH